MKLHRELVQRNIPVAKASVPKKGDLPDAEENALYLQEQNKRRNARWRQICNK